MHSTTNSGLVWFRRDLRTHDNPALHQALAICDTVHCVFVFDRAILDALPRADRRVEFIRESLVELDLALRQLAGKPTAGLIVTHGVAADEIPALALQLGVQSVFTAHDYEPRALQRDAHVQEQLQQQGIDWVTVKDHVIFERREVLTQSGKPYGVFTPYKRAWMALLGAQAPATFNCTPYAQRLAER